MASLADGLDASDHIHGMLNGHHHEDGGKLGVGSGGRGGFGNLAFMPSTADDHFHSHSDKERLAAYEDDEYNPDPDPDLGDKVYVTTSSGSGSGTVHGEVSEEESRSSSMMTSSQWADHCHAPRRAYNSGDQTRLIVVSVLCLIFMLIELIGIDCIDSLA